MKRIWIKEKCKEEALKYNSKIDFKNHNQSAYNSARSNKWLDEICVHMKSIGNKYKRCIYAYEFTDNHIYIGLTYNVNKRENEHLTDKNSSVYKYMKLKNLNPIFYQLTDYIDVNDAKIKEEYFTKKYRNDNWIILNKVKTGGLGTSSLYWTFDKCKEEALKYNKSSNFSKNNKSAYTSALRHNWLYYIYSHMEYISHNNVYWTFDKCKEEALKYSSRTEYSKKNRSAYESSISNKWLDEICSHMIELKKPKNYWTFDKCKEETEKYEYLSDIMKTNCTVYKKILDNNWIILLSNLKRNTKWTKEMCKEEALKYYNRKDFKLNNKKCYKYSTTHKWLYEICSHMN